ncbi:MAG: tetratricopeptide repeat protein [Myxococcota bacterium]
MPPAPNPTKATAAPPKTFNPAQTQFFSIAMLELAEGVPPWVQQAQEKLKNKAWAEAQKIAEDGLKQNPNNLEGLLYLAEAHWEQVNAKEAVDNLKKAIQVAPKDSRPYALLGRYLLLKGLREQAVKFLEQAVALNPDDAESRKQLDRTRNLIKRGYKKVEAAPGAVVSQEAKKEATRMVSLEQVKAGALDAPAAGAATAEPALGQVDLDKALQSLLSAGVLPLDVNQAKQGQTSSGAGLRIASTIVVFSFAVLAGVPAGFLVHKKLSASKTGTPLQRAYALLREDAPSSYVQAADILDKVNSGSPEFEAAQPLMALALAVRAADLGGGDYFRESAERALNAVGEEGSPGLRTAAALLARHLVASHGGKKDAALEEDLKKALEEHPEDAWLDVVVGRMAEDKGDDAAAAEAYRKAHRKDPTLPLALHSLARAHARLGDEKEARALAERLVKLSPNHGPGVILGLFTSHADDTARATFEKAAQSLLDSKATHPDMAARVAMGLALSAYLRGQEDKAGPFLERAASMTDEVPQALAEVARVRLAMGDVDKALSLFQKAAEKEEAEVAFHKDVVRASAAAARGQEWVREVKAQFKAKSEFPVLRLPFGNVVVRPGAITPWETLLHARYFPEGEIAAALDVPDLSPRAAMLRLRAVGAVVRADALVMQGKAREAKDELQKALEEAKKDAALMLALARAEAAAGDRTDALKHIKDAMDLNPQDPAAHLLQARVMLDDGDVAGAMKALQALDNAGFESPRASALKARALAQKGQSAAAEKELKKAAELDPTDPDVAVGAGAAAVASGDWESALRSYTGLARATPEKLPEMAKADPKAAGVIGKALYDAGQKEQGLKVLKQAAKANEEPGAHLYFGLALQAEKDKKGAVEALKQFLENSDERDERRIQAAEALQAMGEEGGDSAPAPKKGKKGKGKRGGR